MPLIIGHRSELCLPLFFNADNRPVTLNDLEEAHTQKIHLLIADVSQTDYHHKHPEPVDTGEYLFSFTPLKTGIYRVWADLKPVLTGVQQYSIADIPAATEQGQLSTDEPENQQAEIKGYEFTLSFDKQLIQERDVVSGRLHVTSPDGKPCARLEVIMGAFGHFVAFHNDFSTVMHIHPNGPAPKDLSSVGGPDLPFYFRSDAAGMVRLFTQVKIEGEDFFPRFVIKVQPLRHLPQR